jgi:hypothetical protein
MESCSKARRVSFIRYDRLVSVCQNVMSDAEKSLHSGRSGA